MNGKWTVILAVVGLLVAGFVFFQKFAYVDFSTLKFSLAPQVTNTSQEPLPPPGATSSKDLDEGQLPQRDKYLNEARAVQYLGVATRDYYNGSYEEALRRLDRAKWYDPHNYGVFKLSGQIQFERSQYRKAFNEWARATQLPNYDQGLIRDLDVLKRLIRYCRNEIDRLQKNVYHDPGDQLSMARLKELELRMSE